MLNVSRLKVLKEVAYRGSLSAAAAALDYSQSAVSQQISALEAETGMKLLERQPRGVTLTAAGQTLMAHTEAILSRIEAAETALSAIAGLRGGRLRAASFPAAGAALMLVAIASFRAQYPDVELTLAEGEPEEIAPRLLAGDLDLALLFEFADEDLALEGVSVVPLLEDPMYLAMPRAHRLAARGRVRLEALPGGARDARGPSIHRRQLPERRRAPGQLGRAPLLRFFPASRGCCWCPLEARQPFFVAFAFRHGHFLPELRVARRRRMNVRAVVD